MNRLQFYSVVTVDEVQEVDLLHHALSNFTLNHEPRKYRVSEIDLMRPDLISNGVYGTVRYWWIICLVNHVDNPFGDMSIGDILNIPNILDIHEFYKRYKVR